jgi:hypothetical protein
MSRYSLIFGRVERHGAGELLERVHRALGVGVYDLRESGPSADRVMSDGAPPAAMAAFCSADPF